MLSTPLKSVTMGSELDRARIVFVSRTVRMSTIPNKTGRERNEAN